MRIIRFAVVLLIACAVIFPQMAAASETADTDTNIKIDFSKISSFFFPASVSAEEIPVTVVDENIAVVAQEEKSKSEEDIRNETLLAKWKNKQADKWKKLPKDKFIINASAYTAAADECGNDRGITSSGLKVKENRTIACPPEFPFGVKIAIEKMGTFVCEDRGGAIKGNHIDIYMLTKKEAFQFGRRNLVAEIVEG